MAISLVPGKPIQAVVTFVNTTTRDSTVIPYTWGIRAWFATLGSTPIRVSNWAEDSGLALAAFAKGSFTLNWKNGLVFATTPWPSKVDLYVMLVDEIGQEHDTGGVENILVVQAPLPPIITPSFTVSSITVA